MNQNEHYAEEDVHDEKYEQRHTLTLSKKVKSPEQAITYPLVITNLAKWKDPLFLIGKSTVSMVNFQ